LTCFFISPHVFWPNRAVFLCTTPRQNTDRRHLGVPPPPHVALVAPHPTCFFWLPFFSFSPFLTGSSPFSVQGAPVVRIFGVFFTISVGQQGSQPPLFRGAFFSCPCASHSIFAESLGRFFRLFLWQRSFGFQVVNGHVVYHFSAQT